MSDVHPESDAWMLYKGTGNAPDEDAEPLELPDAPPWRTFWDKDKGQDIDAAEIQKRKAASFVPQTKAIRMVNAALYLRRPLLVTGDPGTGKSSLAYSVAEELGLGLVLKWPITTRTTLKDGLYSYDAIARLQDSRLNERTPETPPAEKGDETEQVQKPERNPQDIGKYITLGPLGTAFLPRTRPRVLLIDEVDKGDIDLPNDLLTLFEDGEYKIPELQRLPEGTYEVSTQELEQDKRAIKAEIPNGVVRCREFPLVIMTSNGEREFPAPFLRRCLRLEMPLPKDKAELNTILACHLDEALVKEAASFVSQFSEWRNNGTRSLATDQLLQVAFLLTQDRIPDQETRDELEESLFKDLNRSD